MVSILSIELLFFATRFVSDETRVLSMCWSWSEGRIIEVQ